MSSTEYRFRELRGRGLYKGPRPPSVFFKEGRASLVIKSGKHVHRCVATRGRAVSSAMFFLLQFGRAVSSAMFLFVRASLVELALTLRKRAGARDRACRRPAV